MGEWLAECLQNTPGRFDPGYRFHMEDMRMESAPV